jgi:hypothetical protein
MLQTSRDRSVSPAARAWSIAVSGSPLASHQERHPLRWQLAQQLRPQVVGHEPVIPSEPGPHLPAGPPALWATAAKYNPLAIPRSAPAARRPQRHPARRRPPPAGRGLLAVHGQLLDPSSTTRPWARGNATGSGGAAREAISSCAPAGSWAASTATRSRHSRFSSSSTWSRTRATGWGHGRHRCGQPGTTPTIEAPGPASPRTTPGSIGSTRCRATAR